jgi:hypothetical protein
LTQIAKISALVSERLATVKLSGLGSFHSVFRAAGRKSEVLRRRVSWTKKVWLGVSTTILIGGDVMLLGRVSRDRSGVVGQWATYSGPSSVE